nr:unnamed protein product [Callosobruchus analis]
MKNYPTAATVLKRGSFMDNLLWSVETAAVAEAIQLQDELIALLRSGGFELHKWASNCMPLLERVPGKLREMPVAFDDDKDSSIKVLGLQWLPLEDVSSFATLPASSINTKRGVLIRSSLHILCEVFHAETLDAQAWLGRSASSAFEERMACLHIIFYQTLNTSVKSQPSIDSYHQILGFCDASTLGYAAVIYLRWSNGSGDVKVSVLLAKSKVALLKTVSIPRFELLAAHFLVKLVKYTKSLLSDGLTIHDTYFFSDSSVVLAWLNTPCYHLKTFVATRVSKTLDSVNPDCWFHVNGTCSQADICSRGALPPTLLAMPEWLTVCQLDTVSKANSRGYIYDLSEKYSSFTKPQKVLAKCIQFFHNCKSTKSSCVYGAPTLSVLKKPQDALVKAVQNEHFSGDMEALRKGHNCSHSLRKLSPFLDKLGFLRVRVDWARSNLPYSKRHPLLLPKRCNFIIILIDHFHKSYLHAKVLDYIGSQFNPPTLQPIMGNLPKFRSQGINPFHTVGVDI